MKRGIILLVFVFGIAVTTCLSISKSVVKETRDLAGFTKVNFGVSGNLYINLGKEFKVVLEGEQSLLENIETNVSGGKLVIKKSNWRRNMNEKLTVYITMPEVKGLAVSGSGKAEIKDAVKSDDLSLSVSGSGKLFASDVEVSNMNCSISGSGDIILGGNGNISRADLSISGSGSYSGEAAKIATLEISISGSGNCSCYVTESLKASVSGSGSVNYMGSPRVDARVSGSGRVRSN
ncbi:MAG TPA: head GIN domain-containing protein [Bacteroidales bacterium]|nr:head GIN domain-containing protein [Bacteroidales bacterium]